MRLHNSLNESFEVDHRIIDFSITPGQLESLFALQNAEEPIEGFFRTFGIFLQIVGFKNFINFTWNLRLIHLHQSSVQTKKKILQKLFLCKNEIKILFVESFLSVLDIEGVFILFNVTSILKTYFSKVVFIKFIYWIIVV